MNQQAFSNMLDKVLAMFGRNPTQAMNGVCWDVCANLPDAFADYAVEQAGDLDRMPGNMRKFLRDAWFRWRETHPTLVARDQEFGCKRCHSGMIHYVLHRTGYGWTPGADVCGYCRPVGQTFENIVRFGGEVVHPGDAMRICMERNGAKSVPALGENFTARLKAWRDGQRPEERCVPDDERQQEQGWWQ